MASRDVVQEEIRVGVVKQKKVAERGALGEIGNLVTLRPPPATTRPVTRSFRTQLLANTPSENQKKPTAVNVPKFKPTTIKPKPTPPPPPLPENATVIEISPDTQELKKLKSRSSQKKSPHSSLTSTLTARCPKQRKVVDIDAQDMDNELAAVEYVEDLYKFYKLVEVEQMVYFYAELGIMNYHITIRYCPSMVAASAVYAARSTLNKNPVWHDTLEMHTGFTETQVMECGKLMMVSHLMVKDGEKQKVIYEKYSSDKRGMVALYSPPKTMLL